MVKVTDQPYLCLCFIDFQHKITVQASPSMDSRSLNTSPPSSPTLIPRLRAIQCKCTSDNQSTYYINTGTRQTWIKCITKQGNYQIKYFYVCFIVALLLWLGKLPSPNADVVLRECFLPLVCARIDSIRRASMYVYHQDVDITSECQPSTGFRKKGKQLWHCWDVATVCCVCTS